MKLRVTGAQIPVSNDDVDANLETLARAVDRAAADGADVLLTPEGSLSGYTHEFDAGAVAAGLSAVTAKAREAGVGLALGTCFYEDDGRCYNQVRLYDGGGKFLGFHAKILRCGSLGEAPAGEINDYAEAPLRCFRLNGITVGALICNDLWANPACTPMPDPHLTQQLSRMGARIVLHSVNGGRGSAHAPVSWQYHEANLMMRARASKLWIVTVDNAAPVDAKCSAPCGVLSPEGEWAIRTEPVGEQYFTHIIEIDQRTSAQTNEPGEPR